MGYQEMLMNVNEEIFSSIDISTNSTQTSKAKIEFSTSRSDRLIILAHAIFEGIGIGGLLSAAFWYTTAPMAPDGFKGPISTFTIAVSTIASLFLAIPIACLAYKKLIADIDTLYHDLTAEVKEFVTCHDELVYDLLRLRNLFYSDLDFIKRLKPLVEINNNLITPAFIASVCKKYNELKQIQLIIKWQTPLRLVINSKKNRELLNAVWFTELLKDHDLSTNQSIKRALINFIKKSFINDDVNVEKVMHDITYHIPETGFLRNLLYGTGSGVACTEVLLSIGWTVASVLIGIKTIEPVSNIAWICFAAFSLSIGILFGLGMGFSRHKQKTRQLFSLRLKHRNKILIKTSDNINNIYSEHYYGEKRIKNNMEWIYQQ